MAVFAIIASNDGPGLGLKIKSTIQPQDFCEVDGNTWLVSAPQHIVTAKELSDFLGISTGAIGQVVVLHVTTYYGFHKREMWDWLAMKGV
ncbi:MULTISPECIES: hypothetical protein [Klebsiella]|jgi:hypothetical protein|uniref:hypothetical protein n=1 Tax=Klebsiella TaxID=570 RepID=UPI00044B1235|nr:MULTISPECIES: hypothetical protein [Klebsiella]AMH11616.1 hypothetical protein AL511_21810 [Klebsiella aerogenes]ATY07072.1 hypothetical protein AM336_16630 [Klebsiella aerogenes]AXY30085.1 hypothetical protein CEQ05_18035 [Klebsiella aerogenes]EIV6184114.1 hypothetical protein [Klebsiella aerogenes]EKU6674770.1 hypothetical protein [Klebsiella aerogenes]